jgi:hypothetical protein
MIVCILIQHTWIRAKFNPIFKTFIHTVHTFIHTYVHTYIHIYIYTYIQPWCSRCGRVPRGAMGWSTTAVTTTARSTTSDTTTITTSTTRDGERRCSVCVCTVCMNESIYFNSNLFIQCMYVRTYICMYVTHICKCILCALFQYSRTYMYVMYVCM